MNLFWKIFLGFWLSLLLMALGAVVMVRLYDEARLQNPDQVADDKRVGFIIDTTARALQQGGALFYDNAGKSQSELLALYADKRRQVLQYQL